VHSVLNRKSFEEGFNMAYGEETLIPLPITSYGNSVVSTDWLLLGYKCSVGSNGEVFAEMAVPFTRCKVKRIQVLVTETFTAACVIKVWKEAIADNTLLAKFTMSATVVDKVVYLNVADTLLEAGDYISWELDVQDTTTGIILPSVLVEPVPETPANISDMTTTGASTS
jgi:hypothetical protein